MGDYTDLELLESQDRMWEMATPGGAFLGGKPKKRSDYGRRTPGLAEYNAAHGGSRSRGNGRSSVRQITKGGNEMFGILPSPAEQYAMSQGMANQAMDAIQRENDSRVAQRREMRRMANDYEIERMRQMGANQRAQIDAEASLIRQLLADM